MKAVVLLVTLLGSWGAFAQEREAELFFGAIGAGGTYGYTLDAGHYGAAITHLNVRRVHQGGNSALHILEGDVRYNVIGGTERGATTGLEVRGRALVGGQWHPRGTNGCDVYMGMSFAVDGRVHVDASSQDLIAGVGGPETGLICEHNGVLFMASPVVGLGYQGQHPDWNVQNYYHSGFLQLGGRARLLLWQDLYATLEAFFSPSNLANYVASDAYRFMLDISARISSDVRINIAAELLGWEGRLSHIDTTPEDGGPTTTVRDGSSRLHPRGTISIVRTF